MRLSTVLKAFGMFAVAMSGKVIPEAKADFLSNVTICNDFSTDSNIPVIFGNKPIPVKIPPQSCATIQTEDQCEELFYGRKDCAVDVVNQWGLRGVCIMQFFQNGLLNLFTGDVGGCISQENDKYIVYPKTNFTCSDAPITQQPPKLRN